jgi:enoyl-CoA hydratase/carnithine racemase
VPEPGRAYPPLVVSQDGSGAVWTLTLSRPGKANALDAETVECLLTTIAEASTAGARALVLEGAGRNFCAGFDFAGYEEQSAGDLMHRFVRIEQLLQQLRRGPMLSVALARGAAYGAGADLFAACTWRIAAQAARFRFPGFRFGVALGTRHLARVVGVQHARSILLTGRVVDAQEAAAIGLVTHVAEPTADLAAVILQETAALDGKAIDEILRLTGDDTEDADLTSLVRSLARPGLHRRIAQFRESAAVPPGTVKT